ncbi:2Fe-2S iron-sulfur cluster-binding protein [Maritimibacter sp. HL-12]|uniref:2Fe-2S iron-sulfur cluster-binding protein n=1 Tax=Maritimibacter sp. HL-12 TaxID=1162418 RepID=UPI000A0F3DA3|nr:2Fe-2S iron-sulfur cluster-binding protein [Maritimibacter sp. HL-12]SMH53425.1 N-methylglutamate dehydrogenase subunit C [Maritimibacter sp. HL-12]
MSGAFRLSGGLVDRDHRLRFAFNGRQYEGLAGDTLASALLANGVRLVGRSFKYHRPRGIFSAGSEEPNALVTLGEGRAALPNTRATMVELTDGIAAFSQNHLGPLGFDPLAVTDLLAPFLGAGFYYKTFMWPKAFWERVYEPLIRKAAGLGRLPTDPDPRLYDKGHLHCDLLVVGAGPAGLAAARAAGAAGARVILADEGFRPGGRLLAERHEIDGMSGADWAAAQWQALAALPNVRLMPRATALGLYDHGIAGVLERIAPEARAVDKPAEIFWRVRARRIVLAAGATERPLVFPGNDRPGIMLAGAVQAFVNRWAVAPGRRVAILANHDGGEALAAELAGAGLDIAAVIDARGDPQVLGTKGRGGLRSLTLADGRRIACDALAVSGGWSPNLHLAVHRDGKPAWRDDIQAFVPGAALPDGLAVAGAAGGSFGLRDCLDEGTRAGQAAATACGFRPPGAPGFTTDNTQHPPAPFRELSPGQGRAWVDLQNDVTAKDIRLAHREGFRSVEHLKRYTTLGMATDQGKTGNLAALALMAQQTGRGIPETGTTRYRPPYVPVSLGALAGREGGRGFKPVRRTPLHDWSAARGASFVESGLWLRAEWFAQDGESGWRDSVDREVMAVRTAVGICDVSTLGKIDIQGRDAAAFVDFVYCNGFAKLPVGRVRYGLMLREDGIVMDDGTCARLGEHHYLMTTTTANAAPVFQHLEFVRQCLRPDLDVHLVPDTDSWAQIAVAGPKARALLTRLVDAPFDISNAGFPFMACAELTVCGGTKARLFRISFSGELGYELAVPAPFGSALAEAMTGAGADLGVTPYGVEALNVLRIEKGHVSGPELNGQTAPAHLGLRRMAAQGKDYIGRVLAGRTRVDGAETARLVGLLPCDRAQPLTAGAHLLEPGAPRTQAHDLGWISSVAFSPSLGHDIGLALLNDGAARIGTRLRAVDAMAGAEVEVEIVSPHFIDPEGARQRG